MDVEERARRRERNRRWEAVCFAISELLPELSLRQIADAVKRTDGDQEQAVMLLLEAPAPPDVATDTTNPGQQQQRPPASPTSPSEGTLAGSAPTTTDQANAGVRRGDEEEEEALRLAQDESLAMAMQQQLEEESVRAALRELGVSDEDEDPPNGDTRTQSPKKQLQEKEDQGKDAYECQICMDEYPYQQIVLIEACGHGFCADCMTSYITIRIKDRAITAPADPVVDPDQSDPSDILRPVDDSKEEKEEMYGVRCPAFKCTNVLGYADVQNCVSSDLLEEFDSFILNKALQHIPNMTWCPKRCGGGLEVNDSAVKFVQCLNPLCRFTFCKLCSHAHKSKITCEMARQRRENKRNVRPGATPMTKKEREGLRRWALRNKQVRHCPFCWILIEKNMGCDHMRCTRCGRDFSWATASTYQSNRVARAERKK